MKEKKKKQIKITLIIIVIMAALIILGINSYTWMRTGNQQISITTASKVYTESDLYVNVSTKKDGELLENKSKMKLLNNRGKKVRNAKCEQKDGNTILKIPNVSEGKYYIEAKVSTKAGTDKVRKEIYITDKEEENVNISFDKGIYKPGDLVKFRAVILMKDDEKPVNEDVNISIYDGKENRVYNKNVKSSEFGIVSGEFKLANEVNSGVYKLNVKTKSNETTKMFKVNPYIVPKYEIKMNFDKDAYILGDTVKINVNAKYFFGEPVKNANIKVFIDDGQFHETTTDDNGNSTIEYKPNTAKEYSVKLEVKDESNYYVEEKSNFSVGTDIFEIDLIPEYSNLVNDRKNKVYVMTKNIDGTPIKTYVTINSGNFTKQVITDEKGMGSFYIDISNQSSNNSLYKNSKKTQQSFSVIAKNMKDEEVKKDIQLNVETEKTVFKTDKIKYEQNEDVNLEIASIIEGRKSIYAFKNDKLIKTISTNSDETSLNFGDEYGIIDLYILEDNNFNINDEFKRTIFIKPKKELKVAIKTDKEEYKPSENIKLSFETTNEENQGVETALLVSMIDNSVLKLANNDLSIDNIKLALSGLNYLSDEDIVTLYACIIEDKSEETMQSLLLKQSNRDANISKYTTYNIDTKETAAFITILICVICVMIALIFFIRKSKTFREILKHAINIFALFYIIGRINFEILSEFSDVLIYLISVAFSIALYVIYLAKKSENIFKTNMSILFTLTIIGLLSIFYEINPLILGILILIVAILMIVYYVVKVKVKENPDKHKKAQKLLDTISKHSKYMLKFILLEIGVLIVSNIIYNAIDDIDMLDVIFLVLIYIVNYFLNRKKVEEKGSKITLKTLLGIIAVVIVIIVGINAIANTDFDYLDIDQHLSIDDGYSTHSGGSSGSGGLLDPQMVKPTSIDTTNSKDSLLNDFSELPSFNIGKHESAKEELKIDNEVEKTIDDNIRNEFLESMCFIPELITKDGKGNLDLKLSDNITTWTVQAIGNTKNGNVGYGTLNNVKVFKDFFLDFDLPQNLRVGDKISIPITVHNYTKNKLSANIKVYESEKYKIRKNNIVLEVEPEKTKMEYIPIEILDFGEVKFKVETSGNGLVDIVEKQVQIEPKGQKVEKMVSTGNISKNISEDIIFLDNIIERTGKVKVKIYGNNITQAIEGMESIFRLPTGCFEQVSSSLYPNILALEYLNENNLTNENIRRKATEYISTGYQKILSYEVPGQKGGYSLFGMAPAETALTAYGLMELSDAKDVYDVDEKVLENMKNFIYNQQNPDGTFRKTTKDSTSFRSKKSNKASTAYIAWALSEADSKDKRLLKTVEYLKKELPNIDDNYILALIANTLINIEDKEAKTVTNKLVNKIVKQDQLAYLESHGMDYYGTYGNMQNIQATALTSIALSKSKTNQELNRLLLKYIITKKQPNGTWGSTQATILALKALNEELKENQIENQQIKINNNGTEKIITIDKDCLDFYEVEFDNLKKENKVNINAEKENGYYEIIEEYYVPYEDIEHKAKDISIETSFNNTLKVNEIMDANLKIANVGKNNIENGMIQIAIPQGCTLVEESLSKLVYEDKIEKYDMNYKYINLYIREFNTSEFLDLNVKFRTMYPVEAEVLSVKVYDYYNPTVEANAIPQKLVVK